MLFKDLMNPRGRSIVLFGSLTVALFASCARVTRPTTATRVGGRAQEELRRADVLGKISVASVSAQPLSIADIATALESVDPRETYVPGGSDLEEPKDDDEAFLFELLEKYEPEIDDGLVSGDSDPTFFVPADRGELRLIHAQGPFAFNNEQGRQLSDGMNLFASVRSTARIANRLVLGFEPEISWNENRRSTSDDSDVMLRFQELRITGQLANAAITVGRMPMWWGPGRHGSLTISNNARPFDMVHVGSAEPFLLPGILGHLGLIEVQTFAGLLERNRAVPNPIFAGMRVSTRLAPWLEIGANRTAMFGGDGRSLTGQTIVDVVTGHNENEVDDAGDQIASIDMRFSLPFPWQPLEIYGEIGGDDEASNFFSRVGYVAGVYFPRIGPLDWIDFTFEIADNSVEFSGWYQNANFPSGYRHKNDLLGHHMGGNALDVFLAWTIAPCDDTRVRFSYDYEEHSRRADVNERVHQFRLSVEKQVADRLYVSGFYGHDFWHNLGQVAGEGETGHAMGVALRWGL